MTKALSQVGDILLKQVMALDRLRRLKRKKKTTLSLLAGDPFKYGDGLEIDNSLEPAQVPGPPSSVDSQDDDDMDVVEESDHQDLEDIVRWDLGPGHWSEDEFGMRHYRPDDPEFQHRRREELEREAGKPDSPSTSSSESEVGFRTAGNESDFFDVEALIRGEQDIDDQAFSAMLTEPDLARRFKRQLLIAEQKYQDQFEEIMLKPHILRTDQRKLEVIRDLTARLQRIIERTRRVPETVGHRHRTARGPLRGQDEEEAARQRERRRRPGVRRQLHFDDDDDADDDDEDADNDRRRKDRTRKRGRDPDEGW